jgi:hypothetical protein
MLPVDFDEDLARAWGGHVDLLDGSFGGLAVADFDGGLLVLGDVDGGHCNSRSSCFGWWEWWIGSAESALMENQQNKILKGT